MADSRQQSRGWSLSTQTTAGGGGVGSATMVDSGFRGITVGVADQDPDALGAPRRREGWMVKAGSHRYTN
ncbi:MAG TPA: hypothetical protein VMG37_01135 [Solirubrobacteraceae bacterium]|nr:hypothetical protein [Solirubrobacteraceae bacterium]